MTWCNMAALATGMRTRSTRAQSIQAKGEGVGPSAKGQQKRSVHEQFFFLQNFYFLL